MINNTRMCLLGLCLLGAIGLHAQATPLSSGGEATGTGGTVSYSIGQVAYQTRANQGISVAEGVQQAFEISTTSLLESLPVQLSVYPNPVQKQLILSVEPGKEIGLQYQLYDASGKLLTRDALRASETLIDLHTHAPGTYFLRVIHPSGEFSSFSILKH